MQVATRPQWWVVLALCAWSAFWVRMLWRRLLSDPRPGGVHWGEVALLAGFVAFGWGVLFIACAIEERHYERALARIVAPGAGGGKAYE